MPTKRPTPKSDTLYLQRIGSRWYARVPVPNKLRPKLGPYLRKSLETSDIREARERRWEVVSWAKARIAREVGEGERKKPLDHSVGYETFRAKLRDEIGPAYVVNALDGEEMLNPDLERLVDQLEETEAPRELFKAVGDHVQGIPTISEVLEDYLGKNPKGSRTTEANYRTAVKLWIASHGDRPLRGITRKVALSWLNEVAEGKSRDTIKRYVTVLSNLWRWSHREMDERPANPFHELQQDADVKGKSTESYGFFNDAELVRAFHAIENDEELRAVFLISIYTGFRLDECIRAERKDLHSVECYVLMKGKTGNAARVVPVHPRLKDIRVPPGAKADVLSVRFGRAMRKIKMPKGKTFHSLRKAFTTALERADCPEAIAARLLGHSPLGLTYKIYSQGREAKQLLHWVEMVKHPV